MNTVTFEITKTKTLVRIVGTATIEHVDITDTTIEKDFIRLLKKIGERRDQNKILDAIDIDKWGA